MTHPKKNPKTIPFKTMTTFMCFDIRIPKAIATIRATTVHNHNYVCVPIQPMKAQKKT